MRPTYAAENDNVRERLVKLTANLTEKELAQPMADGWTVAAKLIHLAFWDRYYLALLQGWERSGFSQILSNADALNEAVLALSQSIAPKAAVQLAHEAAEAVDRKVEELSAELASAIEAGGHPRILRRALHRGEHLDEIEGFLAKGR